LTRTGLGIAVSAGIALVNAILKIVLRALSKFQRYPSFTLQNLSIMTKLFVALFINMGCLIVIVNANFRQYKFIDSIAQIIPFGDEFFLNGKFSDVTREWFLKVGVPIITLMIINLLGNFIGKCGKIPVKCCMRCCLKKNKVL
jgi:hypothetical protein